MRKKLAKKIMWAIFTKRNNLSFIGDTPEIYRSKSKADEALLTMFGEKIKKVIISYYKK